MKEGICIDGILYTRDNMKKDPKRSATLDPVIVSFLKDWFDSRDHIEAFTSGSTGQPKRIRLKKSYAAASARATLQYFSLAPGASALLALPAQYIAGKMMLIRALEGELQLYTCPPSSQPQIPDRSIDFGAFTPHQFYNMAAVPDLIPDLNIKKIILGGSPVPPDIAEKAAGFQGEIFETFGMTETYSHVAIRQVYPEVSPSFEAVPGVTFHTENDCLVIKAPHLGIHRLRTNDRIRLTDDRHFEWIGRADFVINSGGIKIFPEEIEKKLAEEMTTPFFITGMPHPILGEQVVLVLEKEGAPEKRIEEMIFNRKLSKYEKPRKTIYVHRIEKTPTGKIDRSETLKKDNIFHESK